MERGSPVCEPRVRIEAVPASRGPGVRRRVRSLRIVGHLRAVRPRLVPQGLRGLASLLRRVLAPSRLLRLDLDWVRPVELADPSLRTVGIRHGRLVLDPGAQLGFGVGLVGLRFELRELVPAGLGRSPGLQPQPGAQPLRWSRLRFLAWLDDNPAPVMGAAWARVWCGCAAQRVRECPRRTGRATRSAADARWCVRSARWRLGRSGRGQRPRCSARLDVPAGSGGSPAADPWIWRPGWRTAASSVVADASGRGPVVGSIRQFARPIPVRRWQWRTPNAVFRRVGNAAVG